MATAGLSPSSIARLPTYRSTHLSRYHPYSMASRGHDDDYLMVCDPACFNLEVALSVRVADVSGTDYG